MIIQGDLFAGLEDRDAGLDQVTTNAGSFVEQMRRHAADVVRLRGSVTTDDLREYADSLGITPHHPNAWGAVFRGREWQCVGRVRSRIQSNHAREIRIWTVNITTDEVLI